MQLRLIGIYFLGALLSFILVHGLFILFEKLSVQNAKRLALALEELLISFSEQKFIFFSAIACLTSLVLSLIFFHSWWISILCLIAILLLPHLAIILSRRWYQKKLLQALPNALEFMAMHLEAGKSLSQSVQALSERGNLPLNKEFALVWQSYALGISLADALGKLTERWNHWAFSALPSLLKVSKWTGANTIEILRSLAQSLREELRQEARAKTLSEQAKIQGIIATLLPWALLTAEFFLEPKWVLQSLKNPHAQMCFAGALILDFVGGIFLYRIARGKPE